MASGKYRVRPGAGPNEIALHAALLREDLERSLRAIRDRLDLRIHAERLVATFRRDYRKDPTAFIVTAGGVLAVGAIVLVARLWKGRSGPAKSTARPKRGKRSRDAARERMRRLGLSRDPRLVRARERLLDRKTSRGQR